VLVVERLGGLTYLYVQLTPADLVIVQAEGDLSVKVRDVVAVALEPRSAHLFRSDGAAISLLGGQPPAT
jgi:multiple sugar transport system ATP-binding protein